MLHREPLTVRCCVLLPRSIDRPRPRSHRYSADRPTDRSRGRGLPRTCQGTRPNLSKNQKPSDMRGTAAPKSNALIAPVCRKMAPRKYALATVLIYFYHCAVLEVKQVRLGVRKWVRKSVAPAMVIRSRTARGKGEKGRPRPVVYCRKESGGTYCIEH